MNNSKNDLAWQQLFEKHEILESVKRDGHFVISASNINKYREARLMTKFDHRSQLPKLFSENGLSLLPIKRGDYVIGTFETFFDFNEDVLNVSPIDFPTFLESLDYKEITSEATAINCAFISKILNDFTQEDNLFPTVSGRMSSSIFNFNINSLRGIYNINVDNSQIEIDGGFEGDTSLNLIEAKNYISKDFLVRQLYYPYKLWSNKILKKVRPIFLTYTNGTFNLREYAFSDVNHYNSIVLVKQKKYVIKEGNFNIETLYDIIKRTKSVNEPEIPFPQANSFDRVINLCELINQNQIITKEQYLDDFDFGTIDPRQHDYYTNAARYLGLVDKTRDSNTNQVGYILSQKGKEVMNSNLIDRQKEFVKLIISHKVFRQIMEIYLENGEIPHRESIVEIMKNANLYNITSEETFYRRASTIVGWMNWILSLIEE